jgi:hypothetical protein
MKTAKISRLGGEYSGRAWSLEGAADVHVVDELVGSADVYQAGESNLGNDGAKLAAGCRNTVAG